VPVRAHRGCVYKERWGMVSFDPGGFRIKGPDKYEDQVVFQLKAIEKNGLGGALLDLIDADPHYIWIVPHRGESCNAGLAAENRQDASPKDMAPYVGNEDAESSSEDGEKTVTSSRDDKFAWQGTGAGSDVQVRFSPETYAGSGCGGGLYGSKPDEVLFHELVHSLREIWGHYNPVPTVTDLFVYQNEEEWLAIVVTNIYISLKNGDNDQLREDHRGHTKLRPPLNSSAGFLGNDDHLALVRKFYREEFHFFQLLASIKAPFNPVAEFAKNYHLY
jgi:hypothetical protein